MAIQEDGNLFYIHGKRMSMILENDRGYLLLRHLGAKILSYHHANGMLEKDHAFSGNPQADNRCFSLDTQRQLVGSYGVGANVNRKYSTAEYNNLDIYQINSTYYSALGDDDQKYFMSRLLQVFAPGIPQVYYVGLLAGQNDLELLEETKEGRNINRHYYSNVEIEAEVERPVVKALLKLLAYRNHSSAFDLDGGIKAEMVDEHTLRITRYNADKSSVAEMMANLKEVTYSVTENGQAITFE